jgi:predicted double-glycine peptidase
VARRDNFETRTAQAYWWFTRPISSSSNCRIATTARNALVCAVIGLASVCAVSACESTTQPTASSTPSATTTSATTTASSGNSSPPPSPAGAYGNPAASAKYWIQQSLEDNCGLVSVAEVVGEITGQEPTEQQMISLGENTPSGTNPGPIYAPPNDPSHANGNGGIEMGDEVVLLQHFGIKSAMTDKTNPDQTGLPALQQYLTDNRKIIAWVNSAVIWNTSDQRTKADHFLVVTGIDTNNQIVHLNDPGADHADEQVPVANFTAAWETGGDSIVVTAAAS